MESFLRLSQKASENDINLNDHVERNELFRPLHGGYTTVYQGTIRSTQQEVAIKAIRHSPSEDNDACDRIIEEIRSWSALKHENVVSVFGVATRFDFAVSIISAWVPGGNAYDWVQNRNNDPRPLMLDIARGLRYLHSHGLSHGNLGAHNVLVSADGHALLVDYGLPTLIDSSFLLPAIAPIHPLLRWMAPEQLNNYGKVTTQADVWAFGMTVLELFTRKWPYHDIHDTRIVVDRILNGLPSRPTNESTVGRLTDGWWKMCCMCWECHEHSRPPITAIVVAIEMVELSSTRKGLGSYYMVILLITFTLSLYSLSHMI